jgi:hypothetical protein
MWPPRAWELLLDGYESGVRAGRDGVLDDLGDSYATAHLKTVAESVHDGSWPPGPAHAEIAAYRDRRMAESRERTAAFDAMAPEERYKHAAASWGIDTGTETTAEEEGPERSLEAS